MSATPTPKPPKPLNMDQRKRLVKKFEAAGKAARVALTRSVSLARLQTPPSDMQTTLMLMGAVPNMTKLTAAIKAANANANKEHWDAVQSYHEMDLHTTRSSRWLHRQDNCIQESPHSSQSLNLVPAYGSVDFLKTPLGRCYTPADVTRARQQIAGGERARGRLATAFDERSSAIAATVTHATDELIFDVQASDALACLAGLEEKLTELAAL
jgi:hypothetical protein